MYAFLRECLSGGPSPAPGHTGSHSQLSLEALEGRAVPAVAAVGPTPADPTLATPAQQIEDNNTPTATVISPLANDALLTGILSSQNSLGLPQGGNLNGAQPASPLGQLSPQTVAALQQLQFDQSAAGFQGRLVFPGTGLMDRSATAPGPLAQPPGVFLVGGSGGQTTSDAASPTDQSASGTALDSGDNREDPLIVTRAEEEEDTSSTTTSTEDNDTSDSTDVPSEESQPDDGPIAPPADGE